MSNCNSIIYLKPRHNRYCFLNGFVKQKYFIYQISDLKNRDTIFKLVGSYLVSVFLHDSGYFYPICNGQISDGNLAQLAIIAAGSTLLLFDFTPMRGL